MAPTVGRINFCKENFTCQTDEQSSEEEDNGCRVGSLAMHFKRKLSGIGSSDVAFPIPKPNPWSSNQGQGHPRKRAFLCGVSYKQWRFRLQGTIKDVKNMRSLLIDDFHFPEKNVLVFTEEEEEEDRIPTKKNMQKALKWLVEGSQPGDSLVFYFSGHGLRQPDFDRDEIDGFDETLCPVDFKTAGMILDNEINDTIVKPLKQGVKLHAIIDACHSGTVLDLEYVYDRLKDRWKDNKPPSGAYKGTGGGLAICISACADDQVAADTTAFTKEMAGALTSIFINATRTRPKITYGVLLQVMQERIEDANKRGCLNSKFLDKIFRRKLRQEAQLSSSEEFDVKTKVFNL